MMKDFIGVFIDFFSLYKGYTIHVHLVSGILGFFSVVHGLVCIPCCRKFLSIIMGWQSALKSCG